VSANARKRVDMNMCLILNGTWMEIFESLMYISTQVLNDALIYNEMCVKRCSYRTLRGTLHSA